MARPTKAYQQVVRTYVDSSKVNGLSWAGEALFIRLLTVSDGYGRFHGDPHSVCGKACSARWRNGSTDVDEVERLLRELETAGLIVRYRVGTEDFLEVTEYREVGDRRDSAFPGPLEGWGTERGRSGDTAGTERGPTRARAEPEPEPEPEPERGATAPAPDGASPKKRRKPIRGKYELKLAAEQACLPEAVYGHCMQFVAARVGKRPPLDRGEWAKLFAIAGSDYQALIDTLEAGVRWTSLVNPLKERMARGKAKPYQTRDERSEANIQASLRRLANLKPGQDPFALEAPDAR